MYNKHTVTLIYDKDVVWLTAPRVRRNTTKKKIHAVRKNSSPHNQYET